MQHNEISAQKFFDLARSNFFEGDYGVAIGLYNAAIKINPNNVHYYACRGDAYFKIGSWDAVIADFNEAIRLNPNNANYYACRGHAHLEKGSWDAAMADYSEAIRLNPHDVGVYSSRGSAHFKKGAWDAAIADYKEVIKLNPGIALAYEDLGQAYLQKAASMKSVPSYSHTVNTSHLSDTVRNTSLKRKHDESAEDYCNRVASYLFKCSLHDMNDRLEIANLIADFTEAIKLNANDALAYACRGSAHFKQKSWDDAIKDYSEAIRLNLNFVVIFYHRAHAYYFKKNWVEAIIDYGKAINLKPDSAYAYLNRGNAYFENGLWDAAIADYSKAISLDPNLKSAYQHRGNAHFKKGLWDDAIENFEAVIRLDPNDEIARKSIDSALFRKNKTDTITNTPLKRKHDENVVSNKKIKISENTSSLIRTYDLPIPFFKPLIFNGTTVKAVVKTLRGDNNVMHNCTHLAKDIIAYFKTGCLPTVPSTTEPSTLADFDAITTVGKIKREKGVPYAGITHSAISLEDSHFPDLPYGQDISQTSDGIYDIEAEPAINLSAYNQPHASFHEMNDRLKTEASKNEKGVSFGLINLGRCGKYVDAPGHMLVYFATANQVWYVDAQRYDGINKTDNGCVFTDLGKAYSFAGQHRLGLDTFSDVVFYTPMGPKVIPEVKLVPVKQEFSIR